MAKLVANVYGDALFFLGEEKKTLDALYREVLFVQEIFAANEDLNAFLCHPKVSAEEKETMLQNVFSDKVSQDMLGFLMVILKKSRQESFSDIFAYFVSRYKEYKGIGIVYVTTPYALREEQKRQIEAKILATTGYQTLEVHYSLEKSLIGGIVIRMKDRVIDSSIKNRITQLGRDLRKIQLSE